MKSRSEIWLCALDELGAQCSVNTHRDRENALARWRREGDQFFTVTLPKYGKDLELSLSMRRIPREAFKGFARNKLRIDFVDQNYGFVLDSMKRNGGTPKFLGGFMDLVFNSIVETNYDEYEVISTSSSLDSVHYVPKIRSFGSAEMVRAADAIAAIRQLTLMFAKEEASAPPKAIERAYGEFVETDRDLDSPL